MDIVVKEELARIRVEAGGVLHAEQVIQAAADPTSPLHRFFTWDDTEAARRYRLVQARTLIRVAVVVEPTTLQKIRAYVSLTPDRRHGGGYRQTFEVLSEPVAREQALHDALVALANLRARYGHLRELAEVFAAAQNVTSPTRPGAAGPGLATQGVAGAA